MLQCCLNGWQLPQSSCPTTGCSPQPAAPAQALPLQVLSMGCTYFRSYALLHHGLFQGCMWRSAPYGAHALQGNSLLHCGPLLSRWELLHAWSTSCLPSALTLVAAGLFLPHFLTPLSQLLQCCSEAVFFYPFLNLLSQRHPALLMAQLWPEIGPLGAAGAGSDLARGSAGLCSQKTFLPHPSFPPLTPCPISPVAPNH